jgi:hypothetical protein
MRIYVLRNGKEGIYFLSIEAQKLEFNVQPPDSPIFSSVLNTSFKARFAA